MSPISLGILYLRQLSRLIRRMGHIRTLLFALRRATTTLARLFIDQWA